MAQPLTIYDIAKEAGVSPATVSRVLTSNARVSPAKRGAVEQVIKKHNFKPSALARGLSTSTRILGLMTADIRNPYYATLAVECEKAANAQGYTVLLCNALGDKALEDAHLEKFYAQRVEAIIQIGCRVDDLVSDPAYAEHINRIARTIPFIITGKMDGTDCYSLRIDDKTAMKMLVDHLVSLGHREIAFFGGEKRVKSTYDKWQQYIYLLGHHGLSFRDEYIQEGDYTESGGYDCLKRLLDCPRIPTAAIAVNDYSAVGALWAAHEQGLSIPRDMSLVSFDNTYLSKVVSPKLTTVDYNYPDYGGGLVDIAIRAARGEPVPRLQFVKPRLVIRDSCGPRQENSLQVEDRQRSAGP
ncbi:MAG: LacI family transcriptional regulator [Treponema sp.]|jgi:DNA-binding LacI/PurR family transcriptional regulator|nr:LacI family transcriptional regulator [Treponema sp.]